MDRRTAAVTRSSVFENVGVEPLDASAEELEFINVPTGKPLACGHRKPGEP